MADSDEEGRGERRSKFARERSDADRSMMRKSGRYHDDYYEGSRREKRRPPSPNFPRGGRDSPPGYGHSSKRMKREHWFVSYCRLLWIYCTVLNRLRSELLCSVELPYLLLWRQIFGHYPQFSSQNLYSRITP